MKVSNVQSTIRATVSRALAEALICGIDECDEEKCELTQVQKINLATMSIMSYDKAIEACELIAFEAELDRRTHG